MSENWKDELLCSLLRCGYSDLERLREVLAIAEKLGVTLDDVMEEVEHSIIGAPDLNDLLYATMRLTLDRIAEEVEEGGDGELAERIREHEVYVNFSDSWFNLEALDVRDLEKIGRMTRELIVKAVVEELRK